jgi:uncharacterized protein
MQLTLEPSDQAYVLRSADATSALVNERRLTTSFLIAPDALVEDWPVNSIAALGADELEAVFALEPEVIVLGSGARQAFPPPATLAACLGRGVGLESMSNDAAARTYAVLASEGRRVVAGFVLAPAR